MFPGRLTLAGTPVPGGQLCHLGTKRVCGNAETCLKTWITFPRSLFTEWSLSTYSTGQLRHELGQLPAKFSFPFLPVQSRATEGILPPHHPPSPT